MTPPRDRYRRTVESRAGTITFLAAVWLVAAPAVLDFAAADIAFRPYWVAMTTATVMMVLGMIRALAPLDVPLLGPITFLLASWLVVTGFVRDDGRTAVLVNQMVVGAAIALTCVVSTVLVRLARS